MSYWEERADLIIDNLIRRNLDVSQSKRKKKIKESKELSNEGNMDNSICNGDGNCLLYKREPNPLQ